MATTLKFASDLEAGDVLVIPHAHLGHRAVDRIEYTTNPQTLHRHVIVFPKVDADLVHYVYAIDVMAEIEG